MKQLHKTAVISRCEKYRYKLTRTWDEKKGKVLFIMLNPSTANHIENDLTTIRCINFAEKWGYGGIMIGNIYPFRAKRPKDLKKWLNEGSDYAFWKSGDDNRNHVEEMAKQADLIVCAWGCNYKGGTPGWVKELGDLFYLELCKDDITPKHPLGNISKDAIPTNYNLNTIVFG
jgi:hypothetical protein